MVPSSSARDSHSARSGSSSVFLATLIWGVILLVMPLTIPAPTLARLRGLPFQPRYGFWAMALLTLLCAWPVRRDPKAGGLVLTVSLVLATMFLFSLR